MGARSGARVENTPKNLAILGAFLLLFLHMGRLAPMWQQSGTLLFCSCHGIAEFLVDELQIWIWRHFLEVLPDMTLIFIFKKEYITSLLNMCFNVEYSCHTITNIIHGRWLSLQLMTNWSLTCNYRNACLSIWGSFGYIPLIMWRPFSPCGRLFATFFPWEGGPFWARPPPYENCCGRPCPTCGKSHVLYRYIVHWTCILLYCGYWTLNIYYYYYYYDTQIGYTSKMFSY